jgi:hypothetical protein
LRREEQYFVILLLPVTRVVNGGVKHAFVRIAFIYGVTDSRLPVAQRSAEASNMGHSNYPTATTWVFG